MQTLGLIVGFSWVSTVEYYKFINQGFNEILGGLEFPQCVIYSFNYADIKKYNNTDNWEMTFQLVLKACNDLKQCGVTGIVLCANTMHRIADRLEKETGLPVIHIATATATEIEKQKLKKVGLLGTKFTMEQSFFKERLTKFGIESLIPDEAERDFILTITFSNGQKKTVDLSSLLKNPPPVFSSLLARQGAHQDHMAPKFA